VTDPDNKMYEKANGAGNPANSSAAGVNNVSFRVGAAEHLHVRGGPGPQR
jgi:hypothetical protein